MSTPVLCLPHAGAGASFFRPWLSLGVPGLVLRTVQLPGREERIEEDPYTDLPTAVDGLAAGLAVPDRVALFGHSLGAVLAFELARILTARGVEVVRLFVSGSPGPWAPREQRATGLDDDAFLARVEEFAGYRHPAFDLPELRDLILPTLRADVALHEAYAPPPGTRVDAPITCFRGTHDDLVSTVDAMTWRDATTGDFEYVEFPGGHMYHADDPAPLLAALAARLFVPVLT